MQTFKILTTFGLFIAVQAHSKFEAIHEVKQSGYQIVAIQAV